jgi:hypothetical protein
MVSAFSMSSEPSITLDFQDNRVVPSGCPSKVRTHEKVVAIAERMLDILLLEYYVAVLPATGLVVAAMRSH